MKVSIIGSGHVGATLAMRVAESGLGDVVLLDIVEGLPQGKALDISDAAPLLNHEQSIIGTNSYDDIENSDIVVITAGLARKPGMTREDLISKNAVIIKGVTESIKKKTPNAIIIVVTNPLDIMTYYVYRVSGFDSSKVIGMAGTLDTSRFINLISQETGVPRSGIESFVLGCHGDAMVPLISKTLVNKKPLREVMDAERIDSIVDRTKKRGAEIVAYLKTGSAYYSPSAGVIEIIRAIKNNTKKILSVSAFVTGEYGIEGCFLGVPAEISSKGISRIVELDVEDAERDALRLSADKTRKLLSSLPDTF